MVFTTAVPERNEEDYYQDEDEAVRDDDLGLLGLLIGIGGNWLRLWVWSRRRRRGGGNGL